MDAGDVGDDEYDVAVGVSIAEVTNSSATSADATNSASIRTTKAQIWYVKLDPLDLHFCSYRNFYYSTKMEWPEISFFRDETFARTKS